MSLQAVERETPLGLTVFHQESVGLFATALADKPSWGVGNEKDKDHDEDGGKALEDQG